MFLEADLAAHGASETVHHVDNNERLQCSLNYGRAERERSEFQARLVIIYENINSVRLQFVTLRSRNQ